MWIGIDGRLEIGDWSVLTDFVEVCYAMLFKSSLIALEKSCTWRSIALPNCCFPSKATYILTYLPAYPTLPIVIVVVVVIFIVHRCMHIPNQDPLIPSTAHAPTRLSKHAPIHTRGEFGMSIHQPHLLASSY